MNVFKVYFSAKFGFLKYTGFLHCHKMKIVNTPHYMDPECSLPHSQVPATCPYHEPDTFSPSLPSHILKIHLNIILPSTPVPSKWSFSRRLNHQNPEYTYLLPHTCYMPRPSHFSRFDHPNNIGWAVQIIKLLIM